MRSILVEGESQKLWDKVPDTPNCWTLDVNLLPDFKVSQSEVDLSKINANKSFALTENKKYVSN